MPLARLELFLPEMGATACLFPNFLWLNLQHSKKYPYICAGKQEQSLNGKFLRRESNN
jgi:hypothetical protein